MCGNLYSNAHWIFFRFLLLTLLHVLIIEVTMQAAAGPTRTRQSPDFPRWVREISLYPYCHDQCSTSKTRASKVTCLLDCRESLERSMHRLRRKMSASGSSDEYLMRDARQLNNDVFPSASVTAGEESVSLSSSPSRYTDPSREVINPVKLNDVMRGENRLINKDGGSDKSHEDVAICRIVLENRPLQRR